MSREAAIRERTHKRRVCLPRVRSGTRSYGHRLVEPCEAGRTATEAGDSSGVTSTARGCVRSSTTAMDAGRHTESEGSDPAPHALSTRGRLSGCTRISTVSTVVMIWPHVRSGKGRLRRPDGGQAEQLHRYGDTTRCGACRPMATGRRSAHATELSLHIRRSLCHRQSTEAIACGAARIWCAQKWHAATTAPRPVNGLPSLPSE